MALRTLNAKNAGALDKDLMSIGAFSIDQLMELAGLSVSQAVYRVHPPSKGKKILVACGPGNNGGDGLVAARHLWHYGYQPTVFYPKQSKAEIYERLATQLKNLDVPFTEDFHSSLKTTDYVVDAIFGFSFSGEVRDPFKDPIVAMETCKVPVLSVDAPSSWSIEDGPPVSGPGAKFHPATLISLTAPKPLVKHFTGTHFVGGRFIPQSVAEKYNLDVPDYHGVDQVAEISGTGTEAKKEKVIGLAERQGMWLENAALTLLALSALVICNATAQLDTYDVREATIKGVQNALYSDLTSCRSIIESFIARIEAYNPAINAIITLNTNALSTANEKDSDLAAGNGTGSLFCIPVLLKDNYDTSDMKTTGGCLDLANSQPTVDAPVVTALRNAGAIIIGKANLHELALEGLTVSSLGGQTVNPYDHTRTPGGSSGGTGAAIAASFAVFGTGTDTVNSLRSPASANSLFSVRPTRGLITRSGIIPISFTQDAIGPIARNVDDLAVALTVMASVGYDPNDNVTALIPDSPRHEDYSAALYGGSLKGMRFGLIEGFFNRTASNETDPVNQILDEMTAAITSVGATIVPIISNMFNATAISNAYDTQRFEYRQDMNTYLSQASLHGTHPSTLEELYSSGKFLVIPSQYSYVNTALVSSTDNTTYAGVKLGIQNLTVALENTLKAHGLDAFVYPEQANLVVKIGSSSQSGRNGILAAVTGFPVVTVPAGFSQSSGDAPVGVPIGMEILGLPWTEAKLLNIARLVAEVKRVRRMPKSTEAAVESMRLEEVPIIVPDTRDIPKAYPIGTL